MQIKHHFHWFNLSCLAFLTPSLRFRRKEGTEAWPPTTNRPHHGLASRVHLWLQSVSRNGTLAVLGRRRLGIVARRVHGIARTGAGGRARRHTGASRLCRPRRHRCCRRRRRPQDRGLKLGISPSSPWAPVHARGSPLRGRTCCRRCHPSGRGPAPLRPAPSLGPPLRLCRPRHRPGPRDRPPWSGTPSTTTAWPASHRRTSAGRRPPPCTGSSPSPAPWPPSRAGGPWWPHLGGQCSSALGPEGGFSQQRRRRRQPGSWKCSC